MQVPSWQKRFCVLHGFTATAQSILECYTNKANFEDNEPAQSTYHFDHITEIKYKVMPGSRSEHKHTCEIVCNQKVRWIFAHDINLYRRFCGLRTHFSCITVSLPIFDTSLRAANAAIVSVTFVCYCAVQL